MKLRINWKALWEALKPVLLAAVGGGVVTLADGCSSLTPSAKTQSMSLYAIGIPGITMWGQAPELTQKQMAELFGCAPQNITYHLKEIFKIGELAEASTCKEFLQVQIERVGGCNENQRKRIMRRFGLETESYCLRMRLK